MTRYIPGSKESAQLTSISEVAEPAGNRAPVVAPVGSYTIPIMTPFKLTGSATDPDGDALTYAWTLTVRLRPAVPTVRLFPV